MGLLTKSGYPMLFLILNALDRWGEVSRVEERELWGDYTIEPRWRNIATVGALDVLGSFTVLVIVLAAARQNGYDNCVGFVQVAVALVSGWIYVLYLVITLGLDSFRS
jgi:hypothetical protein